MKLKPEYHQYLYLFGLALMLIGLPLSKSLMSISQFVLVGNWLWEGNLKEKLKKFLSNKPALLLSSVFILHLLGLFYTSDFNYALNDLRIKLPLLILPLVLTGISVSHVWFDRLLHLFLLAVLAGTIAGAAVNFGIVGSPPENPRDISIFISHIRFSLMICLSIYISFYYLLSGKKHLRISIFYLPLILWMMYFLVMLESVTGIVIFILTAFLMILYITFSLKHTMWRRLSAALLLAIPLGAMFYLKPIVADFYNIPPIDANNLQVYSAGGEKYYHDLENKQVENRNYVWSHVAWNELENSWDKKSSFEFSGKDAADQPLYSTLIRFLTSKGLNKDAQGVDALTDKEVAAIEEGIANVKYVEKPNLYTRMYQIGWEIYHYMSGANPEGNSVAQRFEFWKAAIGIIKDNPWTGVGTGDVNNSFQRKYEETNSMLSEKYRLRAHNQFLTMAVAFGILGLFWFLLSLAYPLSTAIKHKNMLLLGFVIIAVLSFVNEDTLETQAGVSFFTFFLCFLLLNHPPLADEERESR